MKKIELKLSKRAYDICICYNEISKIGKVVKPLKLGSDAVIITNPALKRFFGKDLEKSFKLSGFNTRFELVPDSEKAKSQKYYIRLLNNISEFDGLGKRIFIVALGGGVIGDLAGFVASVYRRGTPYIQIPTTLLAQVDSAIGGKVAIDLKVGKNLAGAFYQPRLVFSDISLLKSLPKNDLISGLGEIVKYGIIKSPELFKFLEKNYKKVLKYDKKALQYIIYTCASIKAKVVEKDEHDNKGLRVILNLGHTIGHAIEAASSYSKSYSHGQAVSLGMLSALIISMELGLLDRKAYLRIKSLMKKIGLPTKLKGLKVKDIFSAQEHDKKFIHGKNRFVLPTKIGETIVRENIARNIIKDSIASLL